MKQDILNIITNTNIIKFIIAVTLFVIIDFITGITKAWRTSSIQSSKLKDGIVKIIIYFCFTCVGLVIDFTFGLPNEHLKISITNIFCCIMCGNDLVSIAENVKDWGLDIPNWVFKMFSKEVVGGNTDSLKETFDNMDSVLEKANIKTLDDFKKFNEDTDQLTLEELQELLDGKGSE